MKNILKTTTAVAFCAAIAFGVGMVGAKSSHASEPFIGQIQYFGFNFAPPGWALCDGQLLAVSQNSALFSLLGTIYGGDGETTFALPDMRGRSPLHFGQGPGLSNRRIGSRGGSESATLSAAQMPSHSHTQPAITATLNASSSNGNSQSPTGNSLAPGGSRTRDFQTGAPNVAMNGGSISVTNPATDSTGGGQSHANMPPFLTVNCSIALVGIFPSED